jgi:hypothetical protein
MVWLATKKDDLCTKAAPPRHAPSPKGPVFVTLSCLPKQRAVKMQGSHVIQSGLRRTNLSHLHRLNSLSFSLRLSMLVPHWLRSSQTAEIVALSYKNTTSPTNRIVIGLGCLCVSAWFRRVPISAPLGPETGTGASPSNVDKRDITGQPVGDYVVGLSEDEREDA